MLLSLKLQAHTGAIECTGFLRIKSQLRRVHTNGMCLPTWCMDVTELNYIDSSPTGQLNLPCLLQFVPVQKRPGILHLMSAAATVASPPPPSPPAGPPP